MIRVAASTSDRSLVTLDDSLARSLATPLALIPYSLRDMDMSQFVIIEPKHSAKQNYVPVSNLR
jgi:hypothetical protein